jgi:phenylpyruvate tautomerase PptA (4-oxalocrotonate tautomerase family)
LKRGATVPLVRISLLKGRSADERRAIGDAVHQALVETIDVPAKDRFQIVTEHDAADLVYDPDYLGIARSPLIVMVQITMSSGRTLEQKRALYRRIVERLAATAAVRPEDVWVNLVEVARENWSFGDGLASYAPEEL